MIVILTCIALGLVGLILFIVIYTAQSNSYLGECPASHESVNLTSAAKLGTYSTFAVAMNEKECSKVAKLVLENYLNDFNHDFRLFSDF